MTTTYDPNHDLYTDEADVRAELRLGFNACRDCRRCVDYCSSFPTLFEMLDRDDDRDAGNMTPAEQDRVVEGCFQCKLCVVGCPSAPGVSDIGLDMPRLMLRTAAMRHANGHKSNTEKLATLAVSRADFVGRVGTTMPAVANSIVGAKPSSLPRRVMEKVTGVSAQRTLVPYASERFSEWFAKRPKITMGKKKGVVSVMPTCLVEYRATDVGQDLVKVYERNGIECAVSSSRCCGAPLLHAGDIARFSKVAAKNVKILAAEVRAGADIVVAQPACGFVLKHDYVDVVDSDDARLVADRVFDAAEYLMTVHNADETVLDTDFGGAIPRTVSYHPPGSLQAREIGLPSRDLLKLTGARVRVVNQVAGIETPWGLRVHDDDTSTPLATRLVGELERAGSEVAVTDSELSAAAVLEQSGPAMQHPMQVIARAYGIALEP